ncbi:MAG: amidohydrolase [Gammaproteobacteria bacterium]
MLIIDTQVHAESKRWPRRGLSEFIDEPESVRETPFGIDELRREMDGAGVARAILYPLPGEGEHEPTEAVRRDPGRFALVYPIGPAGGDVRAQVARARALPNLLAVRVMVAGPFWHRPAIDDEWRRQATWDVGPDGPWGILEDIGIPVVAFSPNAVEKLDAVARRHPRLRLVIDEMGLSPNIKDGQVGPRIDALVELARYPNLAVKMAHLRRFSSEPYPLRNLHPHLCRVVNAFGAERVHWASNFSEIVGITYRQTVTMMTESLDCLTSTQKEWVMGRAAAAFFPWP